MDEPFTPETIHPSQMSILADFAWHSPYQDMRFTEAAQQTGFVTDSVETSTGVLQFFGLPEAPLTAWEVDSNIAIPRDLPDNYSVFQRRAEKFPIPTTQECYSTIALTQSDARFNPRFLRNAQKALRTLPEEAFRELTTTAEIEAATRAFQHPDRRDNLEPAVFKTFILNLATVGMLRCFVLDIPQRSEFTGVSLVLTNEDQANLRFYTAERTIAGAGHLLQYKVINQLFNDGTTIVDQSGYAPDTTDQKLAGINEFKQQIGGSIVTFLETSERNAHS